MTDRQLTSKQRCFQIPVGPGALDESNLCKLLAQHGIRYWVNDMAVETVHGITRPVYTVPPDETCACMSVEPRYVTRYCTEHGHWYHWPDTPKPACPKCPSQKANA